jgi:uncharacterized membrane protein YoaK (UPF0700 family)
MPKPRELGNTAIGILEDIAAIVEEIQPEYQSITTLMLEGNLAEAARKLEGMSAGNTVVGQALYQLLDNRCDRAKDTIAKLKQKYPKYKRT